MAEFIRCFKCGGKGRVRNEIDLFSALLTLGMWALVQMSDYHKCNSCDGTGYLKPDRK